MERLAQAGWIEERADGGLEAVVAAFELEVDAVESAIFFADVGDAVALIPPPAEVVELVDLEDLEAQRIVLRGREHH